MIRILDPYVAAQIAAGEVITRPASVIKELLENALDAEAQRISVSISGGGIHEMIIQDDGGGIPADEIELAFERHATSKLQEAEDLYAIQTLGFRGEALPSIAAVAQVTCTSRTADAALGVELRIAGGQIQARSSLGCPPGTTFVVRNLFYNLPVRREFLRSAAAETAAVTQVVTNYALAYPQVRFTLTIDGRQKFQTPGGVRLRDVVLAVYGVDIARQMLPVEVADPGDLTAIRVAGLISPPTLSRGSREAIHLTINRRWVQPRGVVAAMIDDAYHTMLMKGRFPVAVLALDVHPAAVDVNVHPTKAEVTFRDPERVRGFVTQTLQQVLRHAVVVQGWDGAPPPDAPDLETPLRPMPPAMAPDTPVPTLPLPRPPVPRDPGPRVANELPPRPIEPGLPLPPVRPAERVPPPPPPVIREQQTTLDPPPAPRPTAAPGLPPLRALAQLSRTYVLAEGPEGALFLIDQHAAHERITYERLMQQHAAAAVDSQALLLPAMVQVPVVARETLLRMADELATWGFELDDFGGSLRVRSIPATVSPEQIQAALLEIADALLGSGGSTPANWRERMLTTLSCHTSVRAGQTLSLTEQQALIETLAACQSPRTCPHGRPTVISMTINQIARQFGRLG